MTPFEAAFARRCGARSALAFSYARIALRSLLEAAGLEPGDEVVLSPLTCKVVPLAVLSLQLRPVYADIDAETLNLSASALTASLTPKTRAVLFQCTYGSMGGREAVDQIARERGLFLVEDRAQCLASTDHVLSEHSAAIYSNNLGKPLPAGSGGLAVTNDEAIAERVLELRRQLPTARPGVADRLETFGHRFLLRPASYWWLIEIKRRLSPSYRQQRLENEVAREIEDVAGAIGRRQESLGSRWLERIDDIARHRRECCERYESLLAAAEGVKQPAVGWGEPLYYYPIVVAGKQELLRRAQRARIELIPWPSKTPIYPIDDASMLAQYGYRPGQCPVADRIASRLLGLPTHQHVNERVCRRLADLVIDAGRKTGRERVA